MPQRRRSDHIGNFEFHVEIEDVEPSSSLDPSSGDVEETAQRVMLESAKDAQSDLGDQLDAMQDLNRRKKEMRDQISIKQHAQSDAVGDIREEYQERTGLAGLAVGAGIFGILIGLLLFLPAEGLLPMLGVADVPEVGLPPCPDADSSSLWSAPIILALNPVRANLGAPLCDPGAEEDANNNGGGSTGGSQPAGGQAPNGSCACDGTDYLCKNPDGTLASASYNSTQCGGGGQCECRGTALVCPDGTYAEFNPQCGVGGGGSTGVCTCVANPQCAQFPNNCPYPLSVCQENGQSCKP